jgi:hypothetical protein
MRCYVASKAKHAAFWRALSKLAHFVLASWRGKQQSAIERMSQAKSCRNIPPQVGDSYLLAKIEHTIESFAHKPNGGLMLPPDATTSVHRDLIIALAARHHLPAVYALRP